MMKQLGLIAFVSLTGCGGGSDNPSCSDESGIACTYAGTGIRGYNIKDREAHRLDSMLYYPSDLAFGPDGRAYIADWNNHRIRRVETDDRLIDVVGTDYEGDGPPDQEDRLPVGNPAGAIGTTVGMNHPTDMMFGPDGKLYIAAWHNNKLRVWDPATNVLKVLAGDGYGFKGDEGPCYNALFNQPKSIAVADDGTVYTNDQRNLRLRKITPDGIIKTIAGTGTLGNAGDDGLALDAQLGFDTNPTPQPTGGLLLIGNDLYLADSINNRIRRIDLVTGMIHAVAGDAAAGSKGYVDGAAADARFDGPIDLELGPEGKIYVADRYNHAVRTIDLATGNVETVAGTANPCQSLSYCGDLVDGVPARQINLNEPYGIEFDAAGNLYIADTNNNRVLKVNR